MQDYGQFIKGGYNITRRDTPRHWYNYLYNDEYITFTSQVGFGQGFAQDDMGKRIQVVDDRNIYIVENDTFWSAMGLPIYDKAQRFNCLHGIGFTKIKMAKNHIASSCCLFVPSEGKREFWVVTLTNESKQTRKLKLIPYCATGIDCRYEPQGYETDYAGYHQEKNCVIGTGYKAFDSDTVSQQYAYMLSDETVTGFDTRVSAFIGAYGNKEHPKALMETHGCTNSECIAEKICFALENTVTLSPGESKTIYYTIGVESDVESIPQFTPAEIKAQFAAVKQKYSEVLGNVSIHTPWNNLNNLFNDWLKYQTNMGSRWARVRHNGFRDLTSDTECLSSIHAPLAAERICRVLSYQYENGYAPRTFLDGKIQDKNFADNAVWLSFAVYAITKELGNTDFLLREVPFNNGAVATVYEHIKRSVDFLWKFTGHDGLIRIWGGDWNDCMNKAGLDGKGVSVWLSIAFVRAAKMFEQMAQWLGKEGDASTAHHYATEMENRINKYGWDGDRYLYAISDDKTPIGCKESEEGSLFALPQLWSVLAGFDKERCQIAMNTLEKELQTDLGLLISKPPYTKQCSHIGSVTRKYPGLHENGGIYLHAGVWKLAVDSLMQNNRKIEDGLKKILPAHDEFSKSCGEPYVMFNSYLGEQTGYRAGKPGQSWRTASGAWLMYALVRFIYGLQPEFGGLLLKPCLPPSWRDCSITKVFRGCRYNVHYQQLDAGACNRIESVHVNGIYTSPLLPIKPLPGKDLNIEVTLRK